MSNRDLAQTFFAASLATGHEHGAQRHWPANRRGASSSAPAPVRRPLATLRQLLLVTLATFRQGRYGLTAILPLLIAACTTTPSGRTQLLLYSDADMARLGLASFDQMKAEGKLARDPAREREVGCIVDALVAQLPREWRAGTWEVRVFRDDSANAFALPGGKVGVNTGMFAVAENADQLAAVIGHEIGHVVFRHANERVSTSTLAQSGLSLIDAYVGANASANTRKGVMSALGLGTQVGVLLPFSRKHESEADAYGQRLMAMAGFDPNQAIVLWERMQAHSAGVRPPQWLSTHPDPAERIARLRAAAPALASTYQAARAAGRSPHCAASRN